MESVRDYASIIHSPSFTFLVGPRHEKLTIQSGLAKHVSKPLHNLMNGPTRESKHRIAVIEDEDVETFVAFCEYAYTGDYSVPRPKLEDLEEPSVGVVESTPASATWRAEYRSGSMSSAVPPPAPSPPPQHRHRKHSAAYHELTHQREPPTSQCAVEPSPVEVIREAEAPTEAPAEASEPEPQPAQELEASADAPNAEPEPAVYEDTETTPVAPAAEEEPPSEEQWADPNERPVSWEAEEPKSSKKKGKKGKKGKKSNLQPELIEEETPMPAETVNLTPPSTPPPEVAAEPEPEPERELDLVAENDPPAEPTSEPEPEQTQYQEQPVDEPAPAVEEPALAEDQPTFVPEDPMEDSWTQDRNDTIQGQRQRPMLDMSFAQQQASSPCEPGLSLWDEFMSLQYNDEHPVSKPSPIDRGSTDLPYITFHAKVYVFATRYLIPALAQLCLRKLHRDLLVLSLPSDETSESQIFDGLAASKARMVLNLVHYAYTKTARLEPITPTSATQLRENELRRLVVHYAACKVKELARYHSADDSVAATPSLRAVDLKVERGESSAPKNLRALLDVTPELASDLVYRLM
ncbi:uncharacterized protein N7515_008406 [Penicillium bovifimosum]|uniref:BTB domain-containing protein n=1 Tax=Penicillium bovifimosum TaxID=126998 RepID=A0A9W9GMV8_9EURO|nr:uncharacterized protein N7515_008406 [Penicillium bovifimosum]KAJ5124581.1 hypothetical protein N7515_008406 [Penicillium bovifimosum]